jgi:hypothetical protein
VFVVVVIYTLFGLRGERSLGRIAALPLEDEDVPANVEVRR